MIQEDLDLAIPTLSPSGTRNSFLAYWIMREVSRETMCLPRKFQNECNLLLLDLNLDRFNAKRRVHQIISQ